MHGHGNLDHGGDEKLRITWNCKRRHIDHFTWLRKSADGHITHLQGSHVNIERCIPVVVMSHSSRCWLELIKRETEERSIKNQLFVKERGRHIALGVREWMDHSLRSDGPELFQCHGRVLMKSSSQAVLICVKVSQLCKKHGNGSGNFGNDFQAVPSSKGPPQLSVYGTNVGTHLFTIMFLPGERVRWLEPEGRLSISWSLFRLLFDVSKNEENTPREDTIAGLPWRSRQDEEKHTWPVTFNLALFPGNGPSLEDQETFLKEMLFIPHCKFYQCKRGLFRSHTARQKHEERKTKSESKIEWEIPTLHVSSRLHRLS